MARRKLVLLCKRHGVKLRQSYERDGSGLSRQAGRYADARQFERMRPTLLGRVIRGIGRVGPAVHAVWLERAERIWYQRPKDTHKLYALHAPEVECISKGKRASPTNSG